MCRSPPALHGGARHLSRALSWVALMLHRPQIPAPGPGVARATAGRRPLIEVVGSEDAPMEGAGEEEPRIEEVE